MSKPFKWTLISSPLQTFFISFLSRCSTRAEYSNDLCWVPLPLMQAGLLDRMTMATCFSNSFFALWWPFPGQIFGGNQLQWGMELMPCSDKGALTTTLIIQEGTSRQRAFLQKQYKGRQVRRICQIGMKADFNLQQVSSMSNEGHCVSRNKLRYVVCGHSPFYQRTLLIWSVTLRMKRIEDILEFRRSNFIFSKPSGSRTSVLLQRRL